MSAANAVRVVEHAYRLELSSGEWLRGLADEAHADFDDGAGAFAMLYDVADFERPRLLDVERVDTIVDQRVVLPRLLSQAGPALARASLLRSGVGLFTELLQTTLGDAAPELIDSLQRTLGDPPSDLVQVSALEPGGIGVLIGVPCARGAALDRRRARRWSRVVGHLHSALRLRVALRDTAPASSPRAEAIFAPSGRALHATEPAQHALEALREAAVRMDRARSGERDYDERLELWPAMIAGRWSFVEQFESDGRRYLVAMENEPDCRAPRALTQRERQCVHFAACGCSDKQIGYTLGLSPQRVASHLSMARRKLGLRSRVELVALVRALIDAGAAREP